VSVTDTCRLGRYWSQDIGDVVKVMNLGGASGLTFLGWENAQR
jgi:hypothetical protein